MNDVITIENTEMQVREYNGQRVVTFDDICSVHKCERKRLAKHFERKRKHFSKNEDYYELTRKELNDLTSPNSKIVGNPNIKAYLFTESGYLMIVKCLDDDMAWKVQRALVNNYFKATGRKEKVIEPLPEGFPPDYPKPIYNTSSTPVPKNPNWYTRNRRRIFHICENANVPVSALYHQILVRLGEEYDLDAANKIYCEEVGHAPKYALDIVSYFPELARMATAFIDKLEEKMNTQ